MLVSASCGTSPHAPAPRAAHGAGQIEARLSYEGGCLRTQVPDHDCPGRTVYVTLPLAVDPEGAR